MTSFLEKSVIIAAHPDDEILWFSSIMKDVGKIIVVFEDYWADPDIGAKRAAAVAELPHENAISLQIAEAGTYGCADWNKPELCEYGIKFGSEAIKREIKRRIKRALPIKSLTAKTSSRSIEQNYKANYKLIYERLKTELTADMNVFTHNPWGEYGHEEHVQLFRIMDRLRSEIGFKLWMSNYCTDRSLPFAMSYFAKTQTDYIKLQTDKIYAEQVADVYRKHDCWTWADDWQWFEEECFLEAPTSQNNAGAQAHLFPLNLFSI